MRKTLFGAGLVFLITIVCIYATARNDHEASFAFNFPSTIVFEEKLSAYKIFDGNPVDLTPNSNFKLVELSSVLFTDFAQKQRLVKVPKGSKIKGQDDGRVEYPDGSILVKTFFYYNDERKPELGKQIMETRLEIKENGVWNIASYLWNQAQTDASLAIDGFDKKVRWISAGGNSRSTLYHVPAQNECMSCHQSNSAISPIGPSLRNLNRMVERDGKKLNQIQHLQALGILSDFDTNQISQMVDYKDSSASLSERGRAYLDINCAHCHQPNGWKKSNQRNFDFRYETSLAQSGILHKREKISRTLRNGRMPYIGTTMIDEEGIRLVSDYLNSL
ncbi:MAG: hypothetical protein MRZ79_17265 [Bacteroidia bacterium]|nr:hypothetical protein [Bacteroidia bacterium]